MVSMFPSQERRVLSLDEVRRLAPSVFAEQPHHAVSSEYRFIPTIDMVQTLMNEGWEVTQAGEHRVRNASKKGYQKHLLRMRNPNLPKIGDSEVDLLVFNSHDRTSAFKFMAGLFRFVCANGMVAGENLFEPICVKHIGYRAENAIEASYRLIDNVPRIAASVDAMRSMELDGDERMALANAALVAKYGKPEEGELIARVHTPITAEQLLRPRRQADIGRDLWTTFNVIQENAIKGGQPGFKVGENGRNRRQRSRGVQSISENAKLNAALWTLAESMKAIKTGTAA
jgi:hypothetical protein